MTAINPATCRQQKRRDKGNHQANQAQSKQAQRKAVPEASTMHHQAQHWITGLNS
jgi:hypothetical protein